MRPAWEILVRSGSVQHIGLLGGNLVVERFALFRFTRRYPELVGLTPVVRRVNDDVTLVGGRLNAIRTHVLASECRDVTTDLSAR
jgi:hypothetical protein